MCLMRDLLDGDPSQDNSSLAPPSRDNTQAPTAIGGTVHTSVALLPLSFLFIYLFVCLFLAALGLRCSVQAFSSCGERELLFTAVCGLLIAVASLVAEHRV